MQYLRVIFLIILISDCHIHLPTKCQWNIWILIPDIYTNGHQWWLPAHTILWKHEPEDWEKDMRGGSAIREMYLKCFHSIYCCWHFFSLGRPDTVKPANCKFTWTYDLPFSDHICLLAHFVSIWKKIFLIQHLQIDLQAFKKRMQSVEF